MPPLSTTPAPSLNGTAAATRTVDPVLEQYARQLRRELYLVERKLRGEIPGSE